MSAIMWDQIKARHQKLTEQLMQGSFDQAERARIQKEISQLSHVLEKHTALQELDKQIAATSTQKEELAHDAEFAQLFDQEIELLQEKKKKIDVEIEENMFPADEHESRSVFVEIRAGAGGQEASLFASDLTRMYTNYAERHRWKVTLDHESSTDLGGYREVVLHIQGKGAYGHFKFESGVHRVQRVPATETQGRVHTSTVTVAVLPEADEVEININPSDLRIDTYRAGGAGGQHVNRTDSAVRITHIPTGIVVACQDERSQHKNKAKAMKLLQSRILAAQIEQRHKEISKIRKEQVGTGERAEKVRTYNFPQNRITDHQVNVTLKNLDMVMQGALDPIIEALREQERVNRRAAGPVWLSTH